MVTNSEPLEVNEHPYTEVLGRLVQYPQNDGDIDIVVDSTCRISFRNRIANFQQRFGTIHSSESVSDETQIVNKECSEESAVNHATSTIRISLQMKHFFSRVLTFPIIDLVDGIVT